MRLTTRGLSEKETDILQISKPFVHQYGKFSWVPKSIAGWLSRAESVATVDKPMGSFRTPFKLNDSIDKICVINYLVFGKDIQANENEGAAYQSRT